MPHVAATQHAGLPDRPASVGADFPAQALADRLQDLGHGVGELRRLRQDARGRVLDAQAPLRPPALTVQAVQRRRVPPDERREDHDVRHDEERQPHDRVGRAPCWTTSHPTQPTAAGMTIAAGSSRRAMARAGAAAGDGRHQPARRRVEDADAQDREPDRAIGPSG